MSKGGRLWFGFIKLAIWTAAILLFFRLLGHLIGGNFRDLWLPVAVLCTVFITFLVEFLKRLRLPGDTEAKPSALPFYSADPAPTNAETQKQIAEAIDTNATIDIRGLINYSASHRSPGISRSTIDGILQDNNIKPCTTKKHGRAIRNLYPSEESKAAIRKYFIAKGK
jgi:hypothetical protein